MKEFTVMKNRQTQTTAGFKSHELTVIDKPPERESEVPSSGVISRPSKKEGRHKM